MVAKNWTRRNFIKASGAGASLLFSPILGWAGLEEDPVLRIVRSTIGIDTHNHIDVPLHKSEFPGPVLDLKGEMKRSGLGAMCMTFAVDYQKLTREGEAYERFLNGLEAMDEVIRANGMVRSLNSSGIESLFKEHQPTIIQSVEGAHFLEGKIERLEMAYKRGLRHVGLLHDSDASIPLGDIYTNPPKWHGLTAFGMEVIQECNRLGMVIDLTHCSNEAINSALKISNKPMVISHTGLNTQLGQNPFMAKMMMPRLINKDQAKIVGDAGGLIGVWTHLSETPLEYAQNIKAMVNVAGIDHVCIGTDTKMTPAYHGPGKPSLPNNANKNRSDSEPVRIGERTNEAWATQKSGFYYSLVEALIQTGFTEEEIGKIGGKNYLRIFGSATG